MASQLISFRGDQTTLSRVRELQKEHRTGTRRATLHAMLVFAEAEPIRFARIVAEERRRLQPGSNAYQRALRVARESKASGK